jgi:protocatechuate 3,4-dioxygenase beta subunit
MRTYVASWLLLLLSAGSAIGVAQADPQWLAMWTAVQAQRPSSLSSSTRIAKAAEPGTPLLIDGLVVQPDGRTPAAGVVVFAYQTDAAGLYAARPGQPWRLRGWAKTNADGRFEFTTIRPGAYPGRDVAAHVHLTIETANYGRQWESLRFADDPLLTNQERAEAAAAGRFGEVLAVQRDGGVEHVRPVIRLKPKGDF